MPAIFLSHGAPPLVDDATWVSELEAWSGGMPRPDAILAVSAHWEGGIVDNRVDDHGNPSEV